MLENKKIKTALVSVFHKDGLDEILKLLHAEGVNFIRSEERRVGKECRSRWSPYH